MQMYTRNSRNELSDERMAINIIEWYCKLYVLRCLFVKIRHFFNVLDILSQLYNHGLPINVTIIYWDFDYCGPLYYLVLYDKGSLNHI